MSDATGSGRGTSEVEAPSTLPPSLPHPGPALWHTPPGWPKPERHLPVANVARMMKRHLPESTKISKDCKEMMQMCVSEFVAFISSEASEHCLKSRRKTMSGEDVLWALARIGFPDFVPSLHRYLEEYREYERERGRFGRVGGGRAGAAAQDGDDE